MKSPFLENFKSNKKFEAERFNDIDVKLNSRISKMTDPFELSYKSRKKKIANLIKDEKVAKYQQKLMKRRIEQVGQQDIDLDKLVIAINAQNSDLLHLIGVDGIARVRLKKRQERISVLKSGGAGSKNKKSYKNEKKPFFTHKYKIFIDEDSYRYVNFYIADPENPKNKGKTYSHNIEIHLVPTRFSIEQISMIFSHIKSTLNGDRYINLINKARVTQYDTGYMLFGVSQLFAFLKVINNKYKVGASYPQSMKKIKESSYIGELESSNIIGYDKVLKETKFFINYDSKYFSGFLFNEFKDQLDGFSDWYHSLVNTLRVESRQKSQEGYPIRDIENLTIGLEDLRFLKPKYIRMLPETDLLKLLINKSYVKRLRLVKELSKFLGIKFNSEEAAKVLGKKKLKKLIEQGSERDEKSLFFRFDKEELKTSVKKVIGSVVDAIINPSKNFDCEKNEVNYAKKSQENRAILEELARVKREVGVNVENIDFDARKITYVEGCAGSGKTRLISNIVRSLNNEQRESLYIWTFTNASKNDIQERLCDIVPGCRAHLSTLSSWARGVTKEHFGFSKSVIKDEEAVTIIEKILNNKCKKHPEIADTNLTADSIFRAIKFSRAFEKRSFEYNLKKRYPNLLEHIELIEEVYQEYTKFKRKLGREDFDGLLESVCKFFKKKRNVLSITNRMRYLLVDEVQDFDSKQWYILNRLKQCGVKIIVVGDPAQSIYQFRGAIPDNIRDMMLKRQISRFNYRSSQEICDVSNVLRLEISEDFVSTVSKAENPVNEKPRLVDIAKFEDAAAWLINDIQSNFSRYKEISVICRFNYQVDYINDVIKQNLSEIVAQKISCTIHKAKGIEYDAVYFIDPRYIYMGFTNAEEELCNLYVAVSRAKNYLTIIRSKNTVGGTPKERRRFNILDQLSDTGSDIKSGSSLVEIVYA